MDDEDGGVADDCGDATEDDDEDLSEEGEGEGVGLLVVDSLSGQPL